jgi:exopolysaccharide production protein ExoY
MNNTARKTTDHRLTNILYHLRARIRPRAKRLFDISAAFFLIIVFSPLASLVMLTICVSGHLPFYRHVRVGRGERHFYCLKFRSMRSDSDVILAKALQRDTALKAEWDANRKLRCDPRVTRVGRVLRATSLDELPQLVNILVGQMSFVGPRPVTREEFINYYDPPAKAAYSSVRPGLTGLWQVSGRNEIGYDRRVAMDVHYTKHLSLRTDVVILFRTIGAVARRRGAW